MIAICGEWEVWSGSVLVGEREFREGGGNRCGACVHCVLCIFELQIGPEAQFFFFRHESNFLVPFIFFFFFERYLKMCLAPRSGFETSFVLSTRFSSSGTSSLLYPLISVSCLALCVPTRLI